MATTGAPTISTSGVPASSTETFLRLPKESAIELKREFASGQERVVWNPALSIPAKESEFTDPELSRIKAAIQTWESYGVNADRRWLEPVIEALFLEALHT